ncbi:hypothetical protein TrLO_g10421 [Triparma laevis f. longispina]|uniref:Uncharacterized protein n=1 Tax=Triparma laevis f. longispina TaxID=1714387 RepID=A0A9W7FMZ8_9STRA|nr:hypothetical protein TrLO_g10421 [Triparma laevis f. longispina]
MMVALGEEHVVTMETLNHLGAKLNYNGEYEAAKKVWEGNLVVQETVFGEVHKTTLDSMMNLGSIYVKINPDKALEVYERASKGYEILLEKNHPSRLMALTNLAECWMRRFDLDKAVELYQTALVAYEAQFGPDYRQCSFCAVNICRILRCYKKKDFGAGGEVWRRSGEGVQ